MLYTCVLFVEITKAVGIPWSSGGIHQGWAEKFEEGVFTCSGRGEENTERASRDWTVSRGCGSEHWHCRLYYGWVCWRARLQLNLALGLCYYLHFRLSLIVELVLSLPSYTSYLISFSHFPQSKSLEVTVKMKQFLRQYLMTQVGCHNPYIIC